MAVIDYLMRRLGLLVVMSLMLTFVGAYDFCDDGEQGDFLTIESVEDALDDNAVEWEWSPGEDIEIEVNVSSENDEASDYVLELVFLDEDNDEIYIVDDEDDLIEEFELDAEDSTIVELRFTLDDDVDEGDYDFYIKFYEEDNEDEECVEDKTSMEIKDVFICEDGNVDDSDLEIEGIYDNLLENDNSWEWGLGSEVEIEVDVTNDGYSDRDFLVELIFFDEDLDEVSFAQSSGDLTETEEIEKGDTVTFTFNFEVEDDLDEEIYYLYARVTDDGDDSICTSLRAEQEGDEIEVEIIDDLGIFVTSVSGSSSVVEGSVGNYSVKIVNHGSGSQDKILVQAYNSVLGILESELIEDLSAGASKTVDFNILFPSNSSSVGTVSLLFFADYDYDEDKDYYVSSSSDIGADKTYKVSIEAKSTPVIQVTENEENVTVSDEEESQGSVIASGSNESGGENSRFWTWVFIIFFSLALVGSLAFFLMRKKKPKVRGVTSQDYTVRHYTAPNPMNDSNFSSGNSQYGDNSQNY